MSKIIFNTRDMEKLERNLNVLKVSDRSITYNPNFKLRAVQEYLNGKGPQQIFIENGFDLDIIGSKKPKHSLKRWRQTYQKYGEEGFFTERRGRGSTGRRRKNELTVEQKLEKAEARVKLLEAENELLKKIKELERQGMKRKH